MVRIGDCVVYNEDGVCRVENIGTLNIATVDKNRLYYTLRPLSGDGRVYVPVDTALPLRAVISREEAMDLICQLPQIPPEISRMSSKRALEEHYRAMMKPHTPEALAKTLRSVYAKRHDGEKLRPLSSTDEYYRKRSEGLLYQKLAVALDIPLGNVEAFIVDVIETGV